MGFVEDIWTAVLSDDPDEVEASVGRISEDRVAFAIAEAALDSLTTPLEAEDR